MRENYTKTLIKTHKTVKVHVEKDWLSELPRPSAPVKKQKVPRPHPMKGKMKKHTSGAQRWKALKLHREDPKSNYAPPYAISRWKKQEADLLKRPIKELQSKNYFLKKESDVRLTGVFPQQVKTLRKFEKRRGQGKAVSTKWIRNTMFLTCVQDRPPKFDPSKKSQFGPQWVSNYQDRHDLSVRRRTNKKKTSVFERLHKIHGFHACCQYDTVFDDISSVEEDSSSSEESSSTED